MISDRDLMNCDLFFGNLFIGYMHMFRLSIHTVCIVTVNEKNGRFVSVWYISIAFHLFVKY